MIGTQALLLTVFVAATLAAIPNQITVHNHVDPCPGGNYPTIKTFPANGAQQNLNKGQSRNEPEYTVLIKPLKSILLF